jgi:hypothetical protein
MHLDLPSLLLAVAVMNLYTNPCLPNDIFEEWGSGIRMGEILRALDQGSGFSFTQSLWGLYPY